MSYRSGWHAVNMIRVQHHPELAFHKGVIVALSIPESIGRQIAVEGGLPPEEMHITLCYCGKINQYSEEQLRALVKELAFLAACHAPVQGLISGSGRFCGVNDGKDAAYLSFDSPVLPEFRRSVKLITDKYVSVSDLHGFTPHITLAYISPEERHPRERLDAVPVAFDGLELWVGAHHYLMPFMALPEEDQLGHLKLLAARIDAQDIEVISKGQAAPEAEAMNVQAKRLLAALTGDLQHIHQAHLRIDRALDQLQSGHAENSGGLGEVIGQPRGGAVEHAYLDAVHERNVASRVQAVIRNSH